LNAINQTVQNCIDACVCCALECERCAAQSLKGEAGNGVPSRCIELSRQCASVCRAASELMAMGGEFSSLLYNACAKICLACATEWEKYDTADCRHCANACRSCAEECRKLIAELT
jgi:hypothetical protein